MKIIKKIKNPDSESFDRNIKNNNHNTLEKFMELYKSKNKISISHIKHLIKKE
jgi:hypothetical protein